MTLPSFDRLLCPIDFSEASDHALRYAASLARKMRSELHVMTTYQLPLLSMPDGAIVATPELVASLSTASQKRLTEVVATYAKEDLRIVPHVLEGEPHKEIVDLAVKLGTDLIVMGTHGRRGLSHMWLGSVTEKVVRSSTIPVLTVRLPRTE